ncbi:MAG: hypothetical protein WC494_01205 [Candidatus Pacearchaeota archaeon]
MKKQNTFLILLISLFILNSGIVFSLGSSNEEIEIDFFWMEGCPACAQIKPFLENLQENYNFKLNSYETSKNRDLFLQKLDEYEVPDNRKGYVPTIFIKDKYFVGYSDQIKSAIESILQGQTINEEDILVGEKVETKILGIWDYEVSLENKSSLAVGFILGLLDSINVCSITVLVFLIVFSLSVGSSKRAFKIGMIFTLVVFLFYSLFMLLMTGILGYFVAQYGVYIRTALIIISLLAGILLIKDFFWYGKGISLSIPQFAKPLLEKYIKQATIGSTIVLGLLASLVEIPCTAIFPLIYTTILAESGISVFQKTLYILFYNIIYILPLLLIVLGTYLSWTRIENVDETIQKNKKIMKLIAGVALLAIAFYFILSII